MKEIKVELVDKKVEAQKKFEDVSNYFKEIEGLMAISGKYIQEAICFGTGFGVTSIIMSIINKSFNWLNLAIGAVISGTLATLGLISRFKAGKEKRRFIEAEGITEDEYIKLAEVGKDLGETLNFAEGINKKITKAEKKRDKLNLKGKEEKALRVGDSIKTAKMLIHIIENASIPSFKEKLAKLGIIKGLNEREESVEEISSEEIESDIKKHGYMLIGDYNESKETDFGFYEDSVTEEEIEAAIEMQGILKY